MSSSSLHTVGRAIVLALVATLAACGPLRMGNDDRAKIVFTNETLDQATVYAVGGGEPIRIGTVLGSHTETLTVPTSVTARAGTTTIIARLLARSGEPSSGPITLAAGDVVRVRLSADGRTLFITPGG